MALLQILEYPDPRLRIHAEPVTKVDAEIQQLIFDMFETMYDAPGIGLAATQVNVHKRVLIIDISESRDQPLCLINPEILSAERDVKCEEGCLSVPGVFGEVSRAEHIEVRALDENGEAIALDVEGLLAICIQHEMDHLEGILFIDYLSKLKKMMIVKKLSKQKNKVDRIVV